MEENGSPLTDNFHIFLVQPAYSMNIGSVARAMMNLGFRHLHLVDPKPYDPVRAEMTALTAKPILDAMRFHDSLPEALTGMEEVVGLALRRSRNPSNYVSLTEWTAGLPGRADRKTALVFGPEDNGLSHDHLVWCRWIVRIPTTVEFESFNLAQSVLLVLYEITKALPDAVELTQPENRRRWPTGNDYRQLDQRLDRIMRKSRLIDPDPKTPTPDAVRNLFGRLEMTSQEIGILLSLFGRIELTLDQRLSEPTPEDGVDATEPSAPG
ncbi:MAG: TrmH family RNA methyltransferase [Capsulimonadales bacterium]|nr:TrmH family RNA methyltransferase [Capsulimonadales bacterium]